MSRRELTANLVVCAEFAAVGVVWIAYGFWHGWLLAGLSAAGSLLIAVVDQKTERLCMTETWPLGP